jgi:hypothetical protein
MSVTELARIAANAIDISSGDALDCVRRESPSAIGKKNAAAAVLLMKELIAAGATSIKRRSRPGSVPTTRKIQRPT